MNNNKNIFNQPLSLLLPALAGIMACTGCSPVKTDPATPTTHQKNQEAIKPDKMKELLQQHNNISDSYSKDAAVPLTDDPQDTKDDTCFILDDCPIHEPDKANQQAIEFEKRFLNQNAPFYIHEPFIEDEQHEHQTGNKTATDPEKEAHARPASDLPADTNRTLQLVELGKTVFIQQEQHYSLQAGNQQFTTEPPTEKVLAQHFISYESLEMIQNGSNHSIQALNYVGVDFTT